MQIAIVKNGKVQEVGDYRQLFPNVSFPPSGPDAAWLSQNGALPVSTFKAHNSSKARLVLAEPYVLDGVVYTVKVEAFSQAEIDALDASDWVNVRHERNRRLAESDWTQLPDADLNTEEKQQWKTYRQALRDVTEQADPRNITWPVAPNAQATSM